jgi:ribosomal protein L34E
MIMKKTLKTAQQRAKDRKAIRDITKKLHAEAFELVDDFRDEWEARNCKITQIPVGLISRMLSLELHELYSAERRAKKPYVGSEITDDTSWVGYYGEEAN